MKELKVFKHISVCLAAGIAAAMLMTGCGKGKKEQDETSAKAEVIDVDLTALSSTMVYSEVYSMILVPEDYVGKTVKMNGTYTEYKNLNTNTVYPACLIRDATACCSQGIEFLLTEDYAYPDDYPKTDDMICVVGVFETYEEDGNEYIRLNNGRLV